MKIISLQSGSNGNCIYVETPGARIIFDAGISGRQAETRLGGFGRDIRDVDALIISHDHRDHCSAMGVLQRKYRLPVYITSKTLSAAELICDTGRMDRVRFFSAGQSLSIGDVTIHTIPTPHDSSDGVVFVVENAQHRVGILTDLGHVFEGLADIVGALDGVLIESNYDLQMLEQGRYPEFLKRRIQGLGGHISNLEAAHLLRDSSSRRLQWACLCHLSEENNRPELAYRTHREILGGDMPIFVASRYRAEGILEL
jgi:phosphoribosyl 1,2-cyclic phosphodiesterase